MRIFAVQEDATDASIHQSQECGNTAAHHVSRNKNLNLTAAAFRTECNMFKSLTNYLFLSGLFVVSSPRFGH